MPDFDNPVNVKNSRVLISEGYADVVGDHTQPEDISEAVTITVPTGAGIWYAQCADQNVRFTLDGTTPTAALGFILKAGDPPIKVPVNPAATIKVIQAAETAVLEYQFMK